MTGATTMTVHSFWQEFKTDLTIRWLTIWNNRPLMAYIALMATVVNVFYFGTKWGWFG